MRTSRIPVLWVEIDIHKSGASHGSIVFCNVICRHHRGDEELPLQSSFHFLERIAFTSSARFKVSPEVFPLIDWCSIKPLLVTGHLHDKNDSLDTSVRTISSQVETVINLFDCKFGLWPFSLYFLERSFRVSLQCKAENHMVRFKPASLNDN